MRQDDGAYFSGETEAGTAHYHDVSELNIEPTNDSSEYRSAPEVNWYSFLETTYKRPNLEELSRELKLSVESLKSVQFGHDGQAWTNPELDGNGVVIGIKRRFPNGKKNYHKGSRPGLAVPAGWAKSDTILIVEGATDVAAALDMGCKSIGRPSATGGTHHLAVLLESFKGKIILVAENDRKYAGCETFCGHCGQCWPGWYGGNKLATQLTQRLDRTIGFALTPGGAKDLREFKEQDGKELIEKLEVTDHVPF